MKKLLTEWRKFLKESRVSTQYLQKLEAAGIVPGAVIRDHEFSEEKPLIIKIEKVDENGVSWTDSLGGGEIDLYSALEAVNSGDWRATGEMGLPSYFKGIDPPKSKRLDNITELFYGTSTALKDSLVENGVPAPSEWGTYELAESNAAASVDRHGGEMMVVSLSIDDFDKSKFSLYEEKDPRLVYTEDIKLQIQKMDRGVI